MSNRMIEHIGKFLVLVSIVIWLLSFNDVNSPAGADNPILKSMQISTFNLDSLQHFLDEYCDILNKAKINLSEIESEKVTVFNHNKNISFHNNLILNNANKRIAINYIELVDTVIKFRDSIIIADSINSYLEDKRLDSLDQLYEREINLSRIKIKQIIEIVDSLRKDSINIEISIKNHLLKIYEQIIHKQGGARLNICDVIYNIFIVNPKKDNINIHLFNRNNENYFTLDAVKSYLLSQKQEPLMITNAGMYTPKFEPEGLYIEDGGQNYFALDTLKNISNANFYLYPNGVFYLDSNNTPNILTTDNFRKANFGKRSELKLATQSGPMLVVDGELHPKFTKGSVNKKIRSGVGILGQYYVIFAVTINESNFYDFGIFFKDMARCKNALFLDGAISDMYIQNIDTLVSSIKYGPIISVTKR